MRLPGNIGDAHKGKETIHGTHKPSNGVAVVLSLKLTWLVNPHIRRDDWSSRCRGGSTFKLLNMAVQVAHDGRTLISLVLHLLQLNLQL